MNLLEEWILIGALAPVGLMLLMSLWTRLATPDQPGHATLPRAPWRAFQWLSGLALLPPLALLVIGVDGPLVAGWLTLTPLSLTLAMLVQVLGTVIGSFSARYLEGEGSQRAYVASLSGVLAAVHGLLLADHWLLLILAWAGVGVALQPLLCLYPDRAFARLAAHKKRLADRLADALLLIAAALAWHEVGSGSLSDLWTHVATETASKDGLSLLLQLSALALVLAVALRSALLPIHGWLIQVMEAPTPVSALLHAGVVNLGGFVLIRFAPLLEQTLVARAVLLGLGLLTAVLAGMVMLTRISIKVRLAWSTVAQMGFMLVECALGLYTLAALHLIGHSLYKAHAFLAASNVVRQTRLDALQSPSAPSAVTLWLAPALTVSLVLGLQTLVAPDSWPWWWSALLGLAWAPLLWLPSSRSLAQGLKQTVAGLLMVGALSAAALLVHHLPLGVHDAPHELLGRIALAGMAALYLGQILLQLAPQALTRWRRWSYAGFYVDEVYTRLALRLWPTHWAPATVRGPLAGREPQGFGPAA